MKHPRWYLALIAAGAAIALLVWSYRHFMASPALTPQQAYELQREELEAIAHHTVDPGRVKPKYQPPAGFVQPSLQVHSQPNLQTGGRP